MTADFTAEMVRRIKYYLCIDRKNVKKHVALPTVQTVWDAADKAIFEMLYLCNTEVKSALYLWSLARREISKLYCLTNTKTKQL